MAMVAAATGLDADTPEATLESLQRVLGEPLRACLVEMVDECLRHKPQEVEVESYFANVLEPLFHKIATECMERQPEDPVVFIQEWVEEKIKAPSGAATLPNELLGPLPCLKVWLDRQLNTFILRQHPAMDALKAEVYSLRKQLEMLRDGLGRSNAGQQMLVAAEAGDQGAFENALAIFAGNQFVGACDMSVSQMASPSSAEAEAAETMGEVLASLRMRGITSASTAFQHFQPGQDGCISAEQLLNEISSFGNISPERSAHLARSLDRRSTGRIEYRDFRSKISGFLASSREYHPSLSSDELNAILARIRLKLQQQNLTVSDAFKEWDANSSGTLECGEFMAGLRALRLGLSGKEVAQVFNAMAANDPNNGGLVSLQIFATALQKGTAQNRLTELALPAFGKLRCLLEVGAVEKSLKHYCEQPHGQYMHYSGFTALCSDTESQFSPLEIGRLWCVLDKEDGEDEPTVSIGEVLHWMSASNLGGAPLGQALASPLSPNVSASDVANSR